MLWLLYPLFHHLVKDKTLYEAAQELEYLEQVIQETLRMYSPGSM